MKVIAIANQKGGVGKTTIATNLAVEAATAGMRTLLIDTDTQTSAMQFAAARPEGRPAFRTVGIPKPIIHREVAAVRNDYDLILIDAGGRDSAVFRSALAAVDQVLIPITPSAYDVWASDGVFALVDELRVSRPDLMACVVFNQAIPRTIIAREAVDALAPYPVAIAASRLHHRVAWKQSAGEGLGVSEWEPKGEAAAELRALCREIGLLPPEEEKTNEAQAAD